MEKYELDFKKMIVSFYEGGKSVNALAAEYKINKVTLYSWINKYKTLELQSGELITIDELKKMKKRIAMIEEEKERLKKCISIFSEKKGK